MGFRSVYITEDLGIEVPDWFIDKWGSHAYEHNGKRYLPVSSPVEIKTYMYRRGTHQSAEEELYADLRQLLRCDDDKISLLWFHECDGVTRADIYKDRVERYEPTEWQKVDAISHHYCYGCSLPPEPPLERGVTKSKSEAQIYRELGVTPYMPPPYQPSPEELAEEQRIRERLKDPHDA